MIKIYVVGAALAVALSGCSGVVVVDDHDFKADHHDRYNLNRMELVLPEQTMVADSGGAYQFLDGVRYDASSKQNDYFFCAKAETHSARVVGMRLHG